VDHLEDRQEPLSFLFPSISRRRPQCLPFLLPSHVDTLKFFGYKNNGERNKFVVYAPFAKQVADLLGFDEKVGMVLLFPDVNEFDDEDLCWVSKSPSPWESKNTKKKSLR
jgi:hypothetical protein